MNRAKPGRPRSEKAKKAILQAAYELLMKKNMAKITTQELAEKAGVSTATIYRWWQTKEAVLMEGFLHVVNPVLSYGRKKSALQTLREHMKLGVDFFRSNDGKMMLKIIIAGQEQPAIAEVFREKFYLPRRQEAIKVVKRGMANKEIRKDIDPEIVIDALYGPLYFRLFIGHAPLTEEFVENLTNAIFAGIAL